MIDTSFIENLTKDLEKKVKGIQDAGSKRKIISNDICAIDIDSVAIVDLEACEITLTNGIELKWDKTESDKEFIKKIFEEFTKQ